MWFYIESNGYARVCFSPKKKCVINFFFPSSAFREIQDLALALQVVQTIHILGMIQVFLLQKL